MKRFEFRLEQVLKLKKQREWLAEQKARQARMALDAAVAEAASLARQLAQVADSLIARRDQQADPVSWTTRHEQSTRLGQLLQLAEARAEQAREVHAEAEQQRARIAIEVEALLTLQRERWQEYRQEVARERQAQLDEMGLRRWLARRNE
jgi:flagellar FliJ protein